MLDAFYGAFSPACFALLGLWLVVVQIRLPEWRGSAIHRRSSYAIALQFALPGIMTLLALIDPQEPAFWQVSFAITALGGAVALAAARGLPLRGERGPAGEAGRAGEARRLLPALFGLPAYLATISLYVLIGVLAVAGGQAVLRIEAVLLTVVIFAGFNAAWLLLFDDSHRRPADSPAATTEDVAAPLLDSGQPPQQVPAARQPAPDERPAQRGAAGGGTPP